MRWIPFDFGQDGDFMERVPVVSLVKETGKPCRGTEFIRAVEG